MIPLRQQFQALHIWLITTDFNFEINKCQFWEAKLAIPISMGNRALVSRIRGWWHHHCRPVPHLDHLKPYDWLTYTRWFAAPKRQKAVWNRRHEVVAIVKDLDSEFSRISRLAFVRSIFSKYPLESMGFIKSSSSIVVSTLLFDGELEVIW